MYNWCIPLVRQAMGLSPQGKEMQKVRYGSRPPADRLGTTGGSGIRKGTAKQKLFLWNWRRKYSVMYIAWWRHIVITVWASLSCSVLNILCCFFEVLPCNNSQKGSLVTRTTMIQSWIGAQSIHSWNTSHLIAVLMFCKPLFTHKGHKNTYRLQVRINWNRQVKLLA